MNDFNDYRVIEILDEHSILINYGRKQGAADGDKVRIVSVGPEIKDPNTDSSLGTLDSVKATLTIITTYDKFSLCKNIQIRTTNVLTSPLSQWETRTKKVISLDVDKGSVSNREMPEISEIKVGDKVDIL